ncbi:MAG: phosphatase PAP2 family protein [Ginsengibacter sp.]
MPTFKAIIKNNKFYFISSFVFFLLAAFFCLFYTRAESFYFLNTYHSPAATNIFIFFTWLGDGLFCIMVAIALFFLNRRYLSLLVLTSYLLSGLISQLLKYFIIEARPAVFLKESSYKYFIDAVTLHNYHGFPSGHTASAFALATVLAVVISNTIAGLMLLMLAVAVGYSRIYLGQHFLVDVLCGAIIGALSAMLCFYLLNSQHHFFKKRFYYFTSNAREPL